MGIKNFPGSATVLEKKSLKWLWKSFGFCLEKFQKIFKCMWLSVVLHTVYALFLHVAICNTKHNLLQNYDICRRK